jgi:hypothetical protein
MWEQGKGLNVQPFPPELHASGIEPRRRYAQLLMDGGTRGWVCADWGGCSAIRPIYRSSFPVGSTSSHPW